MSYSKLIGVTVAALLAAAPAVAGIPLFGKPALVKATATAVASKAPAKLGATLKARPRVKPRGASAASAAAIDASATFVDKRTGKVVTHHVITNGPVPDTPANRAAYGGPLSNGGEMTAPVGN